MAPLFFYLLMLAASFHFRHSIVKTYWLGLPLLCLFWFTNAQAQGSSDALLIEARALIAEGKAAAAIAKLQA